MLFFHFKIFSTFQKAFLCVHTLKPHDTYGSLSVMVRICLGDSLTFCWNQPHVYQFRSHMWRPCTGQLEPTKRSKENICHPTSTYRCGYVARCVPNNPCLWGPMICTVKYLIIAFSFAYFCVCSCISVYFRISLYIVFILPPKFSRKDMWYSPPEDTSHYHKTPRRVESLPGTELHRVGTNGWNIPWLVLRLVLPGKYVGHDIS